MLAKEPGELPVRDNKGHCFRFRAGNGKSGVFHVDPTFRSWLMHLVSK